MVITIVVLLILAGITINAITGNESVLNKAQEAKNKTNQANAKEQAELAVLNYIQEYWTGRNGAGASYANEREYIAAQLTSNGTHGSYKLAVANGRITVSDLSNNEIVSGSIDEYGIITWGDAGSGGESSGGEEDLPVVVVPQVGDVVNYAPSGKTYTWNKALAETGGTGTVDLKNGTGEAYNITQWKVLRYDPDTKMVDIVPTAPVGSITLKGAQGYNNGVYLLNEVCSTLYANSSKGITARSINEEDFVRAGKQDQEGDNELENAWTRKRASYINIVLKNVDGNDMKYGERANPYTVCTNYPSIYAQEYGSIINEVENNNLNALKQSQQNSTISATDNGATNGYISGATSIQPKQTFYTTDKPWTTTPLLDNKKVSILFPGEADGTNNYCVATRFVQCGGGPSYSIFGMTSTYYRILWYL